MTEEEFVRDILHGNSLTQGKQTLRRKNAAGLVHTYLREEMGEADEIDVRASYALCDLFDCRVCAGHIMQVYVKGIMEGNANKDGHLIFDAEREISLEEAKKIAERVRKKELRKPKRAEEEETPEPKTLCMEEVLQVLASGEHAVLIDVRTAREYATGHIKGAENIPLTELMKNPYAVSGYRNDRIFLYCMEGYQSKVAAQCLLEAGYEKVACFAWKEGKNHV